MNLKYPFLDLGRVNEPYADELVAAAERVIRSGRYIGGPEVEAFERDLSSYTLSLIHISEPTRR